MSPCRPNLLKRCFRCSSTRADLKSSASFRNAWDCIRSLFARQIGLINCLLDSQLASASSSVTKMASRSHCSPFARSTSFMSKTACQISLKDISGAKELASFKVLTGSMRLRRSVVEIGVVILLHVRELLAENDGIIYQKFTYNKLVRLSERNSPSRYRLFRRKLL